MSLLTQPSPRDPIYLAVLGAAAFAAGLWAATPTDVALLLLGVIAGGCLVRAIELGWAVLEPILTNLSKHERKMARKVREAFESHQRQQELQQSSNVSSVAQGDGEFVA
jgi:hypothetical protein